MIVFVDVKKPVSKTDRQGSEHVGSVGSRFPRLRASRPFQAVSPQRLSACERGNLERDSSRKVVLGRCQRLFICFVCLACDGAFLCDLIPRYIWYTWAGDACLCHFQVPLSRPPARLRAERRGLHSEVIPGWRLARLNIGSGSFRRPCRAAECPRFTPTVQPRAGAAHGAPNSKPARRMAAHLVSDSVG
jgi:hypothetical protein